MNEPRCRLADTLMYGFRQAPDSEGFSPLIIFPEPRKSFVRLILQEVAVSVPPAQKFGQSAWDTVCSGGVIHQTTQEIGCKLQHAARGVIYTMVEKGVSK